MRKQFYVFTLLIVLASSVQAFVYDEWQSITQPDGTTFTAHVFGDEISGNQFTADGYAFVYNASDGYYYYAELDAQGDYRASAAKVGIDDPASFGIPVNLQRGAARLAEFKAAYIAQGYARDPNSAVQGTFGDPAFFPCTTDNPCDAYVVMVTFRDAPNWYETHGGDRPWGYSWDLFNRFFNGGYRVGIEDISRYTGQINHAPTGQTPEVLRVFGSLRAYFHEVYGEDVIEFEILNREDTATRQPIWLELPETKEFYAAASPSTFWTAVETAVMNDGGTALSAIPSDFPYMTPPATIPPGTTYVDILRANKVLYLYSGLTVTNRRALHPRVNCVTRVGCTGARYVMGERQGWSGYGHDLHNGDKEHSVDRFAGIGMHVHEWGHLFGLVHPNGEWDGDSTPDNPHTGQSAGDVYFDGTRNRRVTFTQANLSGWGSMQTGEHGTPIVGTNGWVFTHRSNPNPYNPFYRRDLGWNRVNNIGSTVRGHRIDPSPRDMYVVRGANGHEYILDFRRNHRDIPFGRYTGYYRFTSSPGLLIWRRDSRNSNMNFNPMLIPADSRSIFDARYRQFSPEPINDPSYTDPNYTYIWRDRLTDPFGATDPFDPAYMPVTAAMDYETDGTPSLLFHSTQNDTAATSRGDPNGGANPAPGDPSRLIFRNISNEGTHALVDIIFIPFAPSTFAVTAGDGQAALNWMAPTPEHGGTPQYEHRHRSSTDMGTTWTDWTAWTDVGNALTASVRDLTGGETYDFAVRAYSGARTDTAGTAATHEVVIGHLGTVTLGSNNVLATPTVGDVLTAMLADDDDMISGQRWQWERTDDDADEGWTSIGTNMNSYELAKEDVGEQVRVTVTYTDSHGPNKSAASDPTAAVLPANRPPVITTNTEEATNPPVEENSKDVYTYMASDPDDDMILWSLGTENDEALFTLDSAGQLEFLAAPNYEELDSDHPGYTVNVIASDGSLSATLTVTVTVEDMDEPPVITAASDDPPQVVEDTVVITGGSYTASDPDGDPVTWLAITSTGTDKDAFELTGADTDEERTLQFKADALPNYEVKNSYTITLQVQSAPEGDGNLVQSGSLEVTVDVTNGDDPGEVTLSSSQPQVGKKLIATLRDEDGQIVVDRWSWERFPEPFGAEGTSGLAVGEYTPSAGEVGQYLRVTVYYSDGHGATKQAQSVQTAAIVDVPGTPQLTADPGDEQVALTWSAPSSDGGSPILRYHVRYYKADLSDQAEAEWHEVPGGAAAQDTTIKELTNKKAYVFQVVAENAVGRGVPAKKEATPKAPVCTLAGPFAATVAENTPTTKAVATYAFSGNGCGTAKWLALAGTDASAFALQGSGTARTLHFVTAPDYEDKRSYVVTVRIHWGSTATYHQVTVTVSNVDEEGSVALSSTAPRVDHPVTATLTDPDGQITGASWTWQREEGSTWVTVWPSGASGTAAESYSELSSYTPQTADIGHRLQARVSYRDPSSTDAMDFRSAASDPTAAVLGKPGKPQDLAADPGDEQVALTWSAAEANGSPILRYHVRYYKADLSDQAEAEWHEVPGGAAAQDTTIAELTNKKAYVFQVLAENAVGRGVWAEAEATPEAPMCSIAGRGAA